MAGRNGPATRGKRFTGRGCGTLEITWKIAIDPLGERWVAKEKISRGPYRKTGGVNPIGGPSGTD
ncbi:MAG: hypothetical protein ACLFVS_06865 [Candidatus Acetothermia bacterium]